MVSATSNVQVETLRNRLIQEARVYLFRQGGLFEGKYATSPDELSKGPFGEDQILKTYKFIKEAAKENPKTYGHLLERFEPEVERIEKRREKKYGRLFDGTAGVNVMEYAAFFEIHDEVIFPEIEKRCDQARGLCQGPNPRDIGNTDHGPGVPSIPGLC